MSTARTGVYRQLFDSSNPLGIPDLLPEMLWRPVDRWQLTVCGYTPLSRERAGGTVFGYWTDDFRFECCWSKPISMLNKIHRASPQAMVEPDFSTYQNDPLVTQMHAVYKARWVARYWQEHGIAVVPNVQWSDFDSLRWSLLGIPERAPLIAIEGRPRQRKDFTDWARCVRHACAVLRPESVLLYGATAEMADCVPVPVICWTAASPRNRVPIRVALRTQCGRLAEHA